MSTRTVKNGVEGFGIDVRINNRKKISSEMIFSKIMEDAP